MDNLHEELPFVIKQIIGPGFNLHLGQHEPSYGKKHLPAMLRQINVELLTKISALYQADYEMFGYDYPVPLLSP